MKKIYLSFFIFFIGFSGFSQEFNQYVENIINAVNQDSLIQQLRNLSGEDPVIINGQEEVIEHRVSNWGNILPAQYIFETLESYGLETVIDSYSLSGANVVAKQTGTLYPDEYYMICAHYDAVDYYCADDNASGTAAVLEAARIFSELEFEYSIIYALWDEEEIGLIGSDNYATNAATNGNIIHGVINMDMISWDSDGDMVAELHSSYNASSNELADYISDVNSIYGLDINVEIELPGTTASDHSSFWNNGFPSVLVIEEYFGGDFNPYYHTEQDRIAILHMDYFHEMSKLCIGTLAQKSAVDINVGLHADRNSGISEFRVYPNPANKYSQIKLELEDSQNIRISLVNSLGQEVALIQNTFMSQGSHYLEIPLQNLETGIYILKVENEKGMKSQKLMVN